MAFPSYYPGNNPLTPNLGLSLFGLDLLMAQNLITIDTAVGSGGGSVSSVFGRTGAVIAITGDYTVAQITGAAPLASPTFTGIPAAPTAAPGTNTTQLATTAFVTAAVALAPGTVTSVSGTANQILVATGTTTPVLSVPSVFIAPGSISATTTLSGVSLALVDTAANTDLSLTNSTAATSGTAQSSPAVSVGGKYWNGSASAADAWTIQNVVANGTNGASQFQFVHTGSTNANGASGVVIPNVNGVGGLKLRTSDNTSIGSRFDNVIEIYNGGVADIQIVPTGVLHLSSGNFLQWNSASTGLGGSDDTSLSRVSAGVLGVGSGASGSTAGSLSLTNASLGGVVSKYNNVNTVSGGIPAEYATADLTGQTAAIGATTLYTPTATGMFRISIYEKVTAAGGVSSILGGTTGTTITYTDGTDSVAQSIVASLRTEAGVTGKNNAGNATTTSLNGDMIIYAKTGVAIQYAIDYTSSGSAMAYEVHLKLEAL